MQVQTGATLEVESCETPLSVLSLLNTMGFFSPVVGGFLSFTSFQLIQRDIQKS